MKSKDKTGSTTLIRFDRAMKRLFRQKANYRALEGFLSLLLKEGENRTERFCFENEPAQKYKPDKLRLLLHQTGINDNTI